MDLKNEIKAKCEKNKKLIENLNSDEKSLIKKQLVHYHKILNEGKDSRSEGLSWVIKAIWNCGSKVILSYLPKFLDELAIKYIFSVCNQIINTYL